jgi:hypothetical protein
VALAAAPREILRNSAVASASPARVRRAGAGTALFAPAFAGRERSAPAGKRNTLGLTPGKVRV